MPLHAAACAPSAGCIAADAAKPSWRSRRRVLVAPPARDCVVRSSGHARSQCQPDASPRFSQLQPRLLDEQAASACSMSACCSGACRRSAARHSAKSGARSSSIVRAAAGEKATRCFAAPALTFSRPTASAG
eukprot:4505470-Prymnesium_polylepis.1